MPNLDLSPHLKQQMPRVAVSRSPHPGVSVLVKDSPPNFKASPWKKPVHRETIGIQVYPDDKELLK